MLEIKVTLELSKNFEKLLSGFLVLGMQNAETEKKKTCVCAAGEESEEAAEVKEAVQAPISEEVKTAKVTTSKIAYSFEQLQNCAAKIAREGKRDELAAVINGFGVESLLELKPEEYNDFALKLRALGGVI